MTDSAFLLFPFAFGAVIGSFLNVCIHRIPLGISIISPPSRCTACSRRIAFYDNIPIISYIMLLGRCRHCGSPVSLKYPLVEALTGLFAAALFARLGLGADFFVSFAFVASLIVITFIDLKHQIIPDCISLPGIPAGFIASFFLISPGALNSAIGIVAGGGVLFMIAAVYYLATGNVGMGGGDIKLLGMIGAFIGWKGVIVTLLAGSFLGALIGVAVMITSKKSSKYPIPFGPFLAAGAVTYLFYGEALISWYIMRAAGA